MVLIICVSSLTPVRIAASDLLAPIRASAAARDFLAVRVLARKLAVHKKDIGTWNAVRTLLLKHPEIGNDLVLGWERIRPVTGKDKTGQTPVEKTLNRADELLLAGKSGEAFDLYQKCAQWLKKRSRFRARVGRNADLLYPYVLHGMGRALYASGRFADALTVYGWFTPSYPRFRQTLFEKMWSALRAGQVDVALGAIASQRSAFFSRFMNPEAYLIQVYLYKALCRDEDLKGTLAEVSEFKSQLESGTYDYLEWAKSDFEMRALANLAETAVLPNLPPVTIAERTAEREKVRSFLLREFGFYRARLSEHLTLIEAYARLAATPGIGSGLKAIEKLPSRSELFRQNLEIWPADDSEVWIDEVGKHRFIGASLCSSDR
ncbi:MAG: hypothetical protein A2X94_06155 [Bdellovibrionales bacterium GWB1_55_8]|nr:MAG: hypothetical protein A2X94_06155 [Bdellovibrionales bacterium GWB1_55_8]